MVTVTKEGRGGKFAAAGGGLKKGEEGGGPEG
jgi:hypothetical protein